MNKFNSVAEYKSRGELVRDNEQLAEMLYHAYLVVKKAEHIILSVEARRWWRCVPRWARVAVRGLADDIGGVFKRCPFTPRRVNE